MVEQNNEHLELIDGNAAILFSANRAGVFSAKLKQELEIGIGLDLLVERVQRMSNVQIWQIYLATMKLFQYIKCQLLIVSQI